MTTEIKTNKFIEGKTQKCVCRGCDKDASYWDGILLKSRDAVVAGFCESHWFITRCPNYSNIKGCYGVYSKELGILKYTKQSTNAHK